MYGCYVHVHALLNTVSTPASRFLHNNRQSPGWLPVAGIAHLQGQVSLEVQCVPHLCQRGNVLPVMRRLGRNARTNCTRREAASIVATSMLMGVRPREKMVRRVARSALEKLACD